MVYEQSYTSANFVADQEARKSAYKVMQMTNYGQTHNSTGQNGSVKRSKKNNNTNSEKTTDVWGSVFQNKQHFVDMHFC
ncbi:hypothetical protein Hamer_G023689 [Homarus americanus]|uniref:Uncharacterized protein n=1 Tax=Homarus americanus TaxID=6706 RepID=A0A8J5JFN1_HOMAM|nr:hypothetical protein Hamer_G023689 [Homarus americanus]